MIQRWHSSHTNDSWFLCVFCVVFFILYFYKNKFPIMKFVIFEPKYTLEKKTPNFIIFCMSTAQNCIEITIKNENKNKKIQI